MGWTTEGAGDRPETERPAVGVIAADPDAGNVIATVREATLRGFPVYVAHNESVNRDFLELSESLSAELVETDEPDAEESKLRSTLVDLSSENGHPGIIIKSHDVVSVDFERSANALETSEAFAVDAFPRSRQIGCVIGIPAYNEVETIGDVVRQADAYADEVIVVDDGSSDDTAAVAEQAGARVVRHRQNRGYGAALRSVFTEAIRLDADTLAILDADGQHEVSDVHRLVEVQQEADADLVIGSRFLEASETDIPRYRRIGIKVVNVLTNLAVGRLTSDYIRDTQSGFRVYGRRTIETLATDSAIGDGMNASIDILFHAAQHDYEVNEVPTTVRYDVEDTSTMHPVSHGLHLVANIARRSIKDHPLHVLGVPGLFAVCLGLIVWTPFLPRSTQAVFLFSNLLAGLGVLSCLAGFLLHLRTFPS